MIDVHYASLSSQGVQRRVFYLDGHSSRYQPRPTGLNFGEQTGTGVFPLVIAIPHKCITFSYQMMKGLKIHQGFVLFGMSHIVQCMYLHSGRQK